MFVGLLCLGGQLVKKIRNFKERKNKMVVEIRAHLQSFKANKYPIEYKSS